MKTSCRRSLLFGIAALWTFLPGTQADSVTPADAFTRVPVIFSGGHDTDPRDRGRPVILIAGALGVPPETFREAFSHVHPAGPNAGGPTPDEARQNKKALLDVLAPLGITNERLDTVSNYYRYNKSKGEMWPTKPAEAYALVESGSVTRFVITNGGSGYSSPPTVAVPGVQGGNASAHLVYKKEFDGNGSVDSIRFVQ
ncbi:hypothetical protein SAMN05444156_2719 [Verrucomicrobium sp. GAS474]|uniref:hypothetical protein n=1 Tax=Verrucomicrobium sp. GAS474 TaxID=1882831 RepID=UPI00087B6397|nr:hypothetical protein [Verrucomicrobium sp. GAS474]SDU22663.1 hypothetical protein SAMN05444156_2719 [Verrucomicrobium sp. GAS474]